MTSLYDCTLSLHTGSGKKANGKDFNRAHLTTTQREVDSAYPAPVDHKTNPI